MSETYTPGPSMNGIERAAPEPTEARRALVGDILKEVKADEKHWEKAFKRMKADMAFVRKQLPAETEDDPRAKVNIVQRHVNQRLASLYAKNPTFIAERRKRLDFAVWDGTRAALEQATQSMTVGGGEVDPITAALLADVQQAITRQRMLDNVGKTMEILLQYSIDEQQPPFKPQCKQAVRRAIVSTVGYAKLHFQRRLAKRPETEANLADVTAQVANVERLAADLQDSVGKDENSKEAEELRLAEEALTSTPDVIVREGLVFDFPLSRNVIPDRNCSQLAVGFPGARRVSEKFLLSLDEVKEVYGVDLGSSYTSYKTDGAPATVGQDDTKACVYETYDKKAGLKYVVCEGHPDFLVEPVAPPLYYIEPFFPFFPLVFNPIEDEQDIYPDSDVRLLMPIQKEINRKREAIKQHRIASRPLYAAQKGSLGENDSKSLGNHEAHDVIEIEALSDGQKIDQVFQPFPKVGVDPNLYETGTDLTDVQLVVGAQEANLGGTSGDSATENSIAETSRLQSVDSNIDDMDDWFTAIARAAGQVLLKEMDLETVTAVAGPGAVWPELKPQEIAEEVYLKIQAGSSGRPNKAQDLANLERATPLLVQLPGVSPEWLVKHTLRILDPQIDLTEAYTSGLPSITSMNRQAQVGTGDPATDPNAQGGAGGDNQPQDDTSKGGAQASFQQEPTAPGGGGAPSV